MIMKNKFYKRNIMEEKERPQIVILIDAWVDKDKTYVIYKTIDIKSKHEELMLSEKEVENGD